MSAPRISVIMPVYNAAPYVGAAIDSVLAQTCSDFELIIVDDASTDGSKEVIAGFGDERIRKIWQEENLGAAYAKNTGLVVARGEFIAFLDADDIALPGRFAAQLDFLQSHPDISILGSQIAVIDENGTSRGIDSRYPCLPVEIAAELLFINCIAQSSVMLRRGILPREPFRTGFVPAEDYDLWMRLAPGIQFANLSQALVKYRVHDGGVSQRKTEAMRASLRFIHTALIEELGVKPTPQQLDLHRRLSRWPLNPSRELVAQAEAWLLALQKANAASRRHPQAVFDRIIARRWHSVCLDSWQLGWWAWKAWWRSPLRSIAAVPLSEHCRFLRLAMPVSLKRQPPSG